MTYEVRDYGDRVLAGPFVVLDSALNKAVDLTRPPPPPPKQYTHVARTLKTSDTDPYELAGPRPARLQHVLVIELEGTSRRGRTRAWIDDGRIVWGVPCKVCGPIFARDPYARHFCDACNDHRAVRDRT